MPWQGQERLVRDVRRVLAASRGQGEKNLLWLRDHMAPIFFATMREEPETVATLCRELQSLKENRHLVLADREKEVIVARLDLPGSLYETVRLIRAREISYSEISHSYGPVPGLDHALEVQRYQFDRKSDAEIAGAGEPEIPALLRRAVRAAARKGYPDLPGRARGELLRLLWLNNPDYVRLSPPDRVARALWLFHKGREHAGIFLDLEEAEGAVGQSESRILFAVGNPPEQEFLAQIMEVFHRLNLGVRRAYTLNVSAGVHPWFLGTFYVSPRGGGLLDKGSDLFRELRSELYNTMILSVASQTYTDYVIRRLMTGEEASLVNAFIAFSHATLAHSHPERYTFEDVTRAFCFHPEMALVLVRLFEVRFAPGVADRERRYEAALEQASREIEAYNTGHRQIDDFRRSLFRAALVFVRRTLKTNFYVAEKHALSFRLDPAYLDDLPPAFTADLPPERPFRVTFFFGRNGVGFHVGFSDIARGGWRTIIARSRDDFVTAANTLFREVYVLAHTQHLKNKDIYEGGSKMVAILHAPAVETPERLTQLLYQIQYGFANAFFDIFVTENGRAKDPRVVDYYGEDEPIEIGPDENMHDPMIETIARLSIRRGYLLGIGVMSSKVVGISHKAYGVTSTGVVKFAEIAMREQGIDVRRDPFTVNFTGGPNGDVAGNAMRILLERCPAVRIGLILDGTGALRDPAGADREELGRILLKGDVDAFDPMRLSPGGVLLYRNVRRTEGLRELYRRAVRTDEGMREEWVTVDEFHREFDGLLFSVPADIFIPAGGRPETVDGRNWSRFLGDDGTPRVRVIVEGANSFITPEARVRLQERGVVLLRDASANKCGVISSSYEIIANLLMSEREFLAHKEGYVADVLAILEKRAADEAELIFRRKRSAGAGALYTAISDALSVEINGWYARFFELFRTRPELGLSLPYRRALLAHLPAFIRENPAYRRRVKLLPPKYRAAILAVELASTIVYRGGFERNLEEDLKSYVARTFAPQEVESDSPRKT